jgi:hypothetical protein
MNERIQQLAIEADGVFIHKLITGAKQYTFLEKDLAKFAELIIQECISACATDRLGKTAGAEELINQHFGLDDWLKDFRAKPK